MALIECHECGREISTEAKACPQCGARNKSRKQSKFLKWILAPAVITAVVAAYVIFQFAGGSCENAFVRKMFVRTFDHSPYAQLNKLRVIDVMSQKEVSSGGRLEDLVCEVTFKLNNGAELTYMFSIVKSDTAGYLMQIQPIGRK